MSCIFGKKRKRANKKTNKTKHTPKQNNNKYRCDTKICKLHGIKNSKCFV